MKAKRTRKKTPRTLFAVTRSTSPEAVLTRTQVVAVLSAGIPFKGPGDDERARRGRVQKRLADHVAKGLLARRHDGKFDLREVGRWAQENWPGCFDTIPTRHASLTGTGGFRIGGSAHVLCLPGDLAASHGIIAEQDRLISDLKAKLTDAEAQIEDLTPDAKRRREVKRKLREIAKRPRSSARADIKTKKGR